MKNSFLLIFFLFSNLFSIETLSFSKIYDLSLKNSKKIQSLNLKLKSNYENIVQAESRLYPNINFYSSHGKNYYKFENKKNNLTKQEVTNYTITLNQPLFDKTIDSQIDIETSRYNSLSAEINFSKQELAKDILQIYVRLLEIKNKIEMYQAYIKYLECQKELLETQYEMDLSTKTEILEIEIEFNQTKINIEEEELLFEVEYNKLKQYIGNNLKFKISQFNNFEEISKNLNILKKTIIENNDLNLNFQIQKFKHIVKLYKNELRHSEYNHLPKVELNIKYSRNTNVKNNLTFNSSFEQDKEFLLNLAIPISKGGYYNSKVLASKLNMKSSQYELDNLKKELELEYKKFETTFFSSMKTTNLLKNSLKVANLYKENIEKEFKYGLKSKIDLYDSIYQIYKIKDSYIKNIYTLMDSYLSILILTNNFKNLNLLDLLLRQ